MLLTTNARFLQFQQLIECTIKRFFARLVVRALPIHETFFVTDALNFEAYAHLIAAIFATVIAYSTALFLSSLMLVLHYNAKSGTPVH